MEPYTLRLHLTSTQSRIVLKQGRTTLLRAKLPPPARFWGLGAAPPPMLLQALATWLDARLSVVLDVDEPARGYASELIDEMDVGQSSLWYQVTLAPRRRAAPPGDGAPYFGPLPERGAP